MSRMTDFQITILLSSQHSREPRSAEEKRRDSNWQDEQNSVGKRALAFPIQARRPVEIQQEASVNKKPRCA